MDNVSRRCSVCMAPVEPATIFCSASCRDVARILRDAQPNGYETFTLADPSQAPIIDNDVSRALVRAGNAHRLTASTVVAAFVRNELTLDATIWAAHERGMADRDIATALEMRTASIQRRLLNFKTRMHGPARPVAVSAGA